VPRRQAVGGPLESPDAAPTAGSGVPRLLTGRQIEILVQVAHGRTNRQVGEALGISERTVRNHMRTIAKKLSASDRTHAVVMAIGNGWIAIPIVSEPAASAAAEPDVKARLKGQS